MKKMLPFAIASCILLLSSCQKEMPAVDISNNVTDSTGLLVRHVSLWNDGAAPATDSSVTLFTYNAASHLIKAQVAGFAATIYNRDTQERLTSIISLTGPGDTAYTKVFYTGPSSTQVAYVLYSRTSAATVPDSMVFTYASGRVSKTDFFYFNAGAMQRGHYQTWGYDAAGNVTQLEVYNTDSTLNIGYDFEYDDKVNPRYAADDARLPVEWGYTLSPNNIKKQTNHYGNSPATPADYVTYTYMFNSAGKPATGTRAGTAIGTQTEEQRFYYQ